MIEADKIDSLNVNEKWKERFRTVDFYVIDGKWWKYNPEFWKSSYKERMERYNVLYMSDILSTMAVLAFGPIYYLFKGMWLKAIIYSIIAFVTGGFLWPIFFAFAPYDYYRYTVLGKQW